jgi:hypothetical protein
MVRDKYGILVATRNRVEQLSVLLLSITQLEHQPERVVISYSGMNPYDRIKEFKEKLNIELIENIKPGQVSQKKKGLSRFGNEVDWIMFCDDDITLTRDCVSNMLDNISKHQDSHEIGGAGFSLGDYRKKEHGCLEKLGRFVFNLKTHPPGVVRSNGYNTSYIQEQKIIYTSWLNSASIWRAEIAKGYAVQLDDVTHALSEDLIFSYAVSRNHSLIYNPHAVIHMQSTDEKTLSEGQLRYERTYHNLYFVLLNKELSKFGYLWSSLGRMIKSINKDKKESYGNKSGLRNLLDVFNLVFTNKTAEFVLEHRIKNV